MFKKREREREKCFPTITILMLENNLKKSVVIFGGYFSLFCRYELNVYLFTFFFKHTVVSKTVGLLPAFHLPVYLQNDP